MENRQTRTLQAFSHILIFVEQHPMQQPPPLLRSMCASLRASVAKIEKLEQDQRRPYGPDGLSPSETATLSQTIRRVHMMPLVRIAKPLLAFAPGTEAALRVPHARADARTVAAAAMKLANALAPHARLMKAAGYPKDFFTQLRSDARRLALASKSSGQARQRRSHATAAIAAEMKRAMRTVMVIEGLYMRAFATNPDLEKLWRNRRRVSARMGRPKRRKTRAPTLASLDAAT